MKNNIKLINRYFTAIIYREDPNFDKYLSNIINNFYEVTYIEHDRDITEDGEKKKPHIHILFKVGENARRINSVAEQIGIPSNYLEGCNKDKMLKYLIHYGYPKTQYNVEEVIGELKDRLKKIIEEEQPQEIKLNDIIREIEMGQIKSITDLIKYGIKHCSINQIKQTQFLLVKAIEENNQKMLTGTKRFSKIKP